MKWTPSNILAYTKSHDSKIKAILVHADNEGYVNETEKELAKSVVDLKSAFLFDAFEASKLNEQTFFSSLNTLSLTMERRIIRIEGTSKGLDELIKKMLAEYTGDTLVLIRSSYLKKESALRKLFINSPNLAEIVNYGDSEQDIKAFVLQICKSYNKNIDNDALNFIAKSNGIDRLVVKSEVEKIITYTFEKENITLSDALAVIDDNSVSSYDDIIYGCLSGEYSRVSKALSKIIMEENNPSSVGVSIARIFLTHFDKIRECKDKVSRGDDIDVAASSLRPLLHFSIAPAFKKQVMSLDYEMINKSIKLLFNLEKAMKGGKIPAETAIEHYLFEISSLKVSKQ